MVGRQSVALLTLLAVLPLGLPVTVRPEVQDTGGLTGVTTHQVTVASEQALTRGTFLPLATR